MPFGTVINSPFAELLIPCRQFNQIQNQGIIVRNLFLLRSLIAILKLDSPYWELALLSLVNKLLKPDVIQKMKDVIFLHTHGIVIFDV